MCTSFPRRVVVILMYSPSEESEESVRTNAKRKSRVFLFLPPFILMQYSWMFFSRLPHQSARSLLPSPAAHQKKGALQQARALGRLVPVPYVCFRC